MRKCFLFDIGNVLANFDFDILLRKIADDSGNIVKNEIVGKDLEVFHAVEAGAINDQEFVDYINESNGISWTVEDLINIWRDIFSKNDVGYGLFRKAIENGVKVYTLSNIAAHNIEAIERNWPGFFNGAKKLFLSYEIGARKPNAEIYNHILSDIGADGENCFFIDDLPENIDAARKAGINAHQFIPENYDAICKEVDSFFYAN